MWVKRLFALAVVVYILLKLIPLFQEKEELLIMGLPVADESALREEWGDRPFLNALENAEEVLLYDGNTMPYDSNANLFYITQDADSSDYTGEFSVKNDNVKAFWLTDGYEATKALGISEGHIYRIWVTDGDAASILNIIITGMPVISIDADKLDEALSEHVEELAESKAITDLPYVDGRIAVYSAIDEDYGKPSERSSKIYCKRSLSGETITCKLVSDKKEKNKRISLLSMGKHDAWKLYKVSDSDDTSMRMMLAFRLWNNCSIEESLKIPSSYVELVLNGEYQGLYILRPRVDDDYFDLPSKDMLVQTEDIGEYNDAFATYQPDNMADYALWLQATCAYVNLYDDLIIIDKKDGGSLFIPGKPEWVFGMFPKRYGWLAYQSDQRIFKADDFKWTQDKTQGLEDELSKRWMEARYSFLNDDALIAEAESILYDFRQSGLLSRRNVSDESVAAFIDGVRTRYAYVDRYYDTKGEQ